MLDLEALSDALEVHGRVVRVVLAEVKGSAPREAGTSMLVWDGGTQGTIGGGRLEFDAEQQALDMLTDGPDIKVVRQALGPTLNQCCGGAVTVVSELYDTLRYRALSDSFMFQGIWARPVETGAGDLSLPLRRKIEKAEHSDTPLATTMKDGWLVEPVWRARKPVYIYGAGHVGEALVRVLEPLPQFEVFLSDVREHLFEDLPDTIHQDWKNPPTKVMAAAPDDALHFIMTPEHDYDLELCHHLLKRDFGHAGLIGSETKWARFRKRLAQLGHTEAAINRIECPIGDPSLGRHPQAIAVGVAASLLNTSVNTALTERKSA